MVLVDDDGVEADLVGEHHLRQVPLVEVVADLRVVVGVREVDPQRLVLAMIRRQVGVREEVEEVELRFIDETHRDPLGRESRRGREPHLLGRVPFEQMAGAGDDLDRHASGGPRL